MLNYLNYIPLTLGYAVILKCLHYIIKSIWTDGLGYLLGFGVKWNGGPNTWAIITGSTDGIGLSFAKEMAKKGYCLFLMSRNEEKLQKTKEFIQNLAPNCQEIRTLQVDFARMDIYDLIETEINNIPGKIDVLINNVGVGYTNGWRISEIPDSLNFIEKLMNINIMPATKLCQMVLPKMVENNRGIIINLSSITGLVPIPYLSVYSAAKAYINFLSQGLAIEYEDKGIIIQALTSSHVTTNMMSMVDTSAPMATSPDNYVSNALRTIGFEASTYGYWKHRIGGMATVLGTALFGVRRNAELYRDYFENNRIKDDFKIKTN